MTSRYRIRHETVYRYAESVALSHHLLALLPRAMPRQRILASGLAITPEPAALAHRDDWFGNRVTAAIIHELHRELTITATSIVEVDEPYLPIDMTSWEEVVRRLDAPYGEAVGVAECRLPSSQVPVDQTFAAFAAEDFTPGRGLAEAVASFIARLQASCTYDPRATNVSTPVREVLEHRHGVCQDFAHLAIAALRSLGLAARYVSGYLETDPPPGRIKLRGADASHAWLAVWCPLSGWLAFDPTNGCRVGERHITCAWGRDFADVSPVRGVILGGGAHELAVAVDVERDLGAPAEAQWR